MRKITAGLAPLALAGGLAFSQAVAPEEKFQPTDIFITSFRGPALGNSIAYQNK
jgi:hypothetical protein